MEFSVHHLFDPSNLVSHIQIKAIIGLWSECKQMFTVMQVMLTQVRDLENNTEYIWEATLEMIEMVSESESVWK